MGEQIVDWDQNMVKVEGSALVVTGSINGSIVQSDFDHGATLSIGSEAASQLIADSVPANRGITVKATHDNPGTIYIGNSDVTGGTGSATDGFELTGGESVTVEVDNANKLYAIAGSGTTNRASWVVV